MSFTVFAEVVAALVWGWKLTDLPAFQRADLPSPRAAVLGSLTGVRASEGYSTVSRVEPASQWLLSHWHKLTAVYTIPVLVWNGWSGTAGLTVAPACVSGLSPSLSYWRTLLCCCTFTSLAAFRLSEQRDVFPCLTAANFLSGHLLLLGDE